MDAFADMLTRLGYSLADFVMFLVRVRASPLWQGHLIDVTLRAGETSTTFSHQLGRPHRGGVVATSAAPLSVSVLPATSETSMTVSLSAAPASDVTFSLWVF